MKTPFTNPAKRFWLYLPILLATLIWTGGCATQTPDPLAGWQIDFNHQLGQAIANDYQDYIQNLSPKEREFIGYVKYFEDRTGQHAIKITIGLNGTVWEHILIYDKDKKRVRTIKYSNGGYHS